MIYSVVNKYSIYNDELIRLSCSLGLFLLVLLVLEEANQEADGVGWTFLANFKQALCYLGNHIVDKVLTNRS